MQQNAAEVGQVVLAELDRADLAEEGDGYGVGHQQAKVGPGEIEPCLAWNRLAELATPALVAWGDLDFPSVVETCEHLAATIRGARRHVFAGAAHLPNLEQPAAFNRVLLDFCASGAAGRA